MSHATAIASSHPAPHAGIRQKALQEELRELAEVVGPAPLADLLLERAFQIAATDIHLDPNEQGLRVRIRIDGLMHDVLQVPQNMSLPMISRLKLMAGMDISERRLAQDGHISSHVLSHQRDVRVASTPTTAGERLVLRLMPDSKSFHKLEELGLEPEQIVELQRHIRAPYGMILSVGPVGSGKSSTMYSCLELLNVGTESLVTIEDPVERRIPGVNQTQIDGKIGFGFVEALRATLRQDPDVMMIGEIRDPETAQIGTRAALSGILVLSTLHANDTAASIDVFREFGVPPMIIADGMVAVLSQRLLRKVCPDCREPVQPDEGMRQLLRLDSSSGHTLVRGKGCESCFGTGYLGRTGVFELLHVDQDIRRGVLRGASRMELMELATSKGMPTLEMAAARKVRAGITTVEEMYRVLTAFPGS